jgi:hypothetical protein
MRKIMTDLLLLVGGGIILLLGGYQFGVNIGTERTRQAAIDSGMAQWSIDPKTGDKRFEFKGVHNDTSKIQNP